MVVLVVLAVEVVELGRVRLELEILPQLHHLKEIMAVALPVMEVRAVGVQVQQAVLVAILMLERVVLALHPQFLVLQ